MVARQDCLSNVQCSIDHKKYGFKSWQCIQKHTHQFCKYIEHEVTFQWHPGTSHMTPTPKPLWVAPWVMRVALWKLTQCQPHPGGSCELHPKGPCGSHPGRSYKFTRRGHVGAALSEFRNSCESHTEDHRAAAGPESLNFIQVRRYVFAILFSSILRGSSTVPNSI